MNPDVKGEYVCEDPDSRMNKGEPAGDCISSMSIYFLIDLELELPWEGGGAGGFANICTLVRRDDACVHGVVHVQLGLFLFSD